MHNREDTIWFVPSERVPAPELKLETGFESPAWKRLVSIYRTAIDYFGGSVQLGMTDLGGNLDILQSSLPGGELALALYDYPEDVKRLTWEVHDAWWTYFDELDRMLKQTNPGYTAWAPILSKDPYYMLQCDFAYMIGPEMFDEFVRSELEATCKRLARPFYHLDGAGQIPHLPSLLGIEELSGVQWIPGDGAPDTTRWPQVYRDIIEADRKT